jgi:hypothetical protein
MANINTLEKDKFTTNDAGDVCVRVCGDFSSGDPVLTSILSAPDRVLLITYADFGTPQQRITLLNYSSPSILGVEAHKTLSYTLVGTRYRRDSIIWSIVNV